MIGILLIIFTFFDFGKFQDFQANCINAKLAHFPTYNTGQFYDVNLSPLSMKILNFKKFNEDQSKINFTLTTTFKPEKQPVGSPRGVILEIPEFIEIYIKRANAAKEEYFIGLGEIKGTSGTINEKEIELPIYSTETGYQKIFIILGIDSKSERTNINLIVGIQQEKDFVFKQLQLSMNGHGALPSSLEKVQILNKNCNGKVNSCDTSVIPAKGEVGLVHGYSVSFYLDDDEALISGDVGGRGVIWGEVSWEEYYFHFLKNLSWRKTC